MSKTETRTSANFTAHDEWWQFCQQGQDSVTLVDLPIFLLLQVRWSSEAKCVIHSDAELNT